MALDLGGHLMKNCLVAGVTHSGKTIFSRRLAEEYGYSRIPGDPLVLAFQKSFPQLGIGHDRDLYASACQQFGRFLVGLMDALAWESTMPYVVDTFHAWPANLRDIDRSKSTVLFFGYPEADPQEKTEHARRYCKGYTGWIAGSPEEVRARFRRLIQMSRDLRDECLKHGFHFIDTSHAFADVLSETARLAAAQGGGDD